MPKKRTKISAKNLAKAKSLAARRFRDRNRRFRKLTTKQQKLKIIKDVVAHLETERIKAATGRYIKLAQRRKLNVTENLHEVLEKSNCNVCAIGGMFASAVLLNNALQVKDLGDDAVDELNNTGVDLPILTDYLSKWFDKGELREIETSFEKGNFGYGNSQSVDFGKRYRDAKSRLIAICKNMLENKGIFVP